jgi:hypothetical protein
VFVTAQGSPTARFRRALAGGRPAPVLAAAAELAYVDLEDALAVCLVLARAGDRRYPRAAGRLLGRIALERDLQLGEALRAGVALVELGADPGSTPPRDTLEGLVAVARREDAG